MSKAPNSIMALVARFEEQRESYLRIVVEYRSG